MIFRTFDRAPGLTLFLMLLVAGCLDWTIEEGGVVFPDGDGDVDGDSDTDTDTDSDTDSDSDSDAGTCPADMHAMPLIGVCIDRYEASQGGGDRAVSVAGARPWVNLDWDEAMAACSAAGKNLCGGTDWSFACRGGFGKNWSFPYGFDYEEQACNGADHGLGAALPTGEMETCEGAFDGLFDFSGNVAEWTADIFCSSDGTCSIMGGSFNSPESELVCDMPTTVDSGTKRADLGFRCCRGM